MATVRSDTLIGRDAELTELSSWLGIGASQDATAEHALLLGGDAGVGKTRLLTEVRDVAVDQGWRVVAGHCLDVADGSLSWLPFTEILGRLTTELPSIVTDVVERHPALARLQPGQRVRGATDPSPAPDRSLEPGRVFAAVHDLLDSAAADAPLLVVVEDAHWADESTRDLLGYLFTRPFTSPVRLVVSYRSDDLHRRHPLRRKLAEWTRLPGVERLQLEPLSEDAVRWLVKTLRRGTLSEEEFVAIVDRAGGNPFFVEELVRAWGSGQVPTELADLLLVRLDQLEGPVRDVLRLVSVAGRRVSHDLLAAVSGLDALTLEDALREAIEANVLEAGPDASYSFRHALLGEAVYDDLLPGERTRLHATFAQALRDGAARGASAELAQHARRSGDLVGALLAEVDAGREARAVGGISEAATHYLEALDVLEGITAPEDFDVVTLVRRTADALMSSGRADKAVKVLSGHVADLPDDTSDAVRGQLLTSLGHALGHADTDQEPAKVSGEAVELLRSGPEQSLARALAVHADALGPWHETEAREAAMEALALAERHDLTDLVVELTTTLANLGSEGDEGLRQAWASAAEEALAQGFAEAELRARYFLARHFHDRGRLEDAVATYRLIVRRGRETGLPWSSYTAEARVLMGFALTDLGRLDEAWEVLDVTGERPPLTYEWLYFAQQMQIKQGIRGRRHGDAAERLRAHWSRDGLLAIACGGTEILRAEADGEAARATEAYDEVVAAVRPLWHEWFQARLRLATVAVGAWAGAAPSMTAEERRTADEVVRRLHGDGGSVIEFYRDYEASRGPEYQAWEARRTAEHLRWRWLAGLDAPEPDELVAAWRHAVEAAEGHGAVFELARARARLGAVLKATGDPAGAREQTDLARAAAHDLDARPLLAELGATPLATRAAEVPAVTLTPREREILTLVAAGRTNGQIGKQLFIATKTVSVHVSNILGKLGAASRTEAAALARRDGLL